MLINHPSQHYGLYGKVTQYNAGFLITEALIIS